MFAVAVLAAKRAGRRRPASIIMVGFILLAIGLAVLVVVVPRATSGWWMVVPLLIAGCGMGLLVSQLGGFIWSMQHTLTEECCVSSRSTKGPRKRVYDWQDKAAFF